MTGRSEEPGSAHAGSGMAARERRFWEAQAQARTAAEVRREAHFVGEEPLFRHLLAQVEALAPLRLLDVGCGRGTTSLHLARRVPVVVGVDVAVDGLRAGVELARAAAVPPRFAAGALEELPFRDGTFDAVLGRFVLHHAHDLAAAGREIERVLRPGGQAFFVETWGGNPLLRLGRDVAGLLGIGMGTADERPLDQASLAVLGERFHVTPAFPVFTAFELSNRALRRLKPLAARSQRFRRALAAAWTRAIAADRWVERRLPRARSLGWFVALTLTKR